MRGFVQIFFLTNFLLIGSAFRSGAQLAGSETESDRLTLRINPLSFIEADGNVSAGIGYQWHRRWAITFDPGWIFYGPYSRSYGVTSVSGIKIRSDVRFLFDPAANGKFRSFIAPEFHYKNVSTRKEDDFGINCGSGQCDYYQRAEYKEAKREIGGSVKVGTLIPWTSRLSLELYGGFGIKFLKFAVSDIPIGGSFISPPENDPIAANNNRRSPQLIVPAGLKIIYRLR